MKFGFVLGWVAVVGVAVGCSYDGNGIGGASVDSLPDAGKSDVVGRGGAGGTGAGGVTGSGGVHAAGGISGAGGVGGVSGTGGSGDIDAGPDLSVPDVPKPPLGIGAFCGPGDTCASGTCVDGVCCESACGSACMACTAEKTGDVDGRCRAVKMGSDPDNDCTADPGMPCGATGVCAMGACQVAAAGTRCGGSATCTGRSLTAAPQCNGTGTCVTAAPEVCPGNLRCESPTNCRTSCQADNECAGTAFCDTNTGTCKLPSALGLACDPAKAGKDCSSGNCVDGVCCDSPCLGTCVACTINKTGVKSGTCAPVKANTDPDQECAAQPSTSCGTTGVCDGSKAACKLWADGTVCGTTCCSRNQGPGGGGARPCSYVCRAGTCDTNDPQPATEACGGLLCCCPNSGPQGQATCSFPSLCANCVP